MGKGRECDNRSPFLYHKKRGRKRKSAAVCQMNPLNTEKEKLYIEVSKNY